MSPATCARGFVATALMVVATALACAGESAAPSTPGVQLAFDRDSLLLDAIHDTTRIGVTVRDAAGRVVADEVTWHSANPAIAAVDAEGRVRSVGAGRTTLRASAGAAVDSLVVRVSPIARSVAFEADTVRFATIGRSVSPSSTVRDRNAVPLATASRHWWVGDPAVAHVTPEGTLTAIAAGTTVVVVEVDALRDSAVVVVRPVAARLALSSQALVVDRGATTTVTANAVDSGGTAILASGVAHFVSRDPGVAAIDATTGALLGIAAGTTTVVATAVAETAVTDSARVVVAAPEWVIGRVSVADHDPLGLPPGAVLRVHVALDASRLSQPGALGAAEATLQWDPAVLVLDSLRSGVDAAANQTTAGVVALAYAAVDTAVDGTAGIATLYLRVVSSGAAGRDAALSLSTPYLPVGLDFLPVGDWAALSDRVRVR